MQSGGIMQPGPQSVIPVQYGQYQPGGGQQQQSAVRRGCFKRTFFDVL
jgi:hypothetical protein